MSRCFKHYDVKRNFFIDMAVVFLQPVRSESVNKSLYAMLATLRFS